jgi:DNA-binding MarR family transcriptional regulator
MKSKISHLSESRESKGLFIEGQSGFYIRRLHQIAAALFTKETAEFGITSVQFGVLMTTYEHPGIDQRTLAQMIRFDASTIGGVIDRLERRGLMQRNASPTDRRVRLLALTAEGEDMLERMVPLILQARERILAPLPPTQRRTFMSMVKKLVDAHEAAVDEDELNEPE